MSFQKIHLKRTSGAIPAGTDVESLCGRTIRKAQAVTLCEGVADPMHHPLLCEKCKLRGLKENEMWGRSYEWGMCDGQEARDEGI